jgi:hypothetical protein
LHNDNVKFNDDYNTHSTTLHNDNVKFNDDYNTHSKTLHNDNVKFDTDFNTHSKTLHNDNVKFDTDFNAHSKTLHNDNVKFDTDFNAHSKTLHDDINKLITTLSIKYDTLISTLTLKLDKIDATLNRRVPTKKELMYEVTSEQFKYSTFDTSSPNDIAKKGLHRSNMLWNELVKAKICDGEAIDIKEEIKCQTIVVMFNGKVLQDNEKITLTYNNTNNKYKLNASVTPSNASITKLDYKSMDPDIIEVNNGDITIKSTGVTCIMISTTDGTSITKTITVEIK